MGLVVAKLQVKIQRLRVQWKMEMEAPMARISQAKRNGLILTSKDLIKSLVEKVFEIFFGIICV